ncbi:MAG: hypothetical protein AB7E47_05985 [Desulfovibrionaceae bacterium]
MASSKDQPLADAEIQAAIMKKLARHPSAPRAIGMATLYEAVFGHAPHGKINGTRRLRKHITALRAEGVAIGMTSSGTGGGYYLATTRSDLDDYCTRLRVQALRKLALAAKIRNTTLPSLLAEIQLNLMPGEAGNA